MKYLDDVTCIDQDFGDRGFVKIVPYAIKLEDHFTPEERENNRFKGKKFNHNERNKRCNKIRESMTIENISKATEAWNRRSDNG